MSICNDFECSDRPAKGTVIGGGENGSQGRRHDPDTKKKRLFFVGVLKNECAEVPSAAACDCQAVFGVFG